MAEKDTGQDRTEQATPKRIKDARAKGQVPKSRELNTMMVVMTGALTLWMMGPAIGEQFFQVIQTPLQLDRQILETPEKMITVFADSIYQSFIIFTPLLVLLFIAAIAGPVSLGGFNISSEALNLKLDKLNPISGLKRIFSLQGLVELVKTLAKFAFVAGLASLILWFYSDEIWLLGQGHAKLDLIKSFELITLAFFLLSSVLILLALFDVPWQLWQYAKQLRMTKQEVRDEMKDTEGKPEVKGHIRQMQQQIAMRRMMQDVADADVIVTNPSHYSVAIRYQEADGAPVVLAKGMDVAALKIREIASENEITIFEAPPLARALYASTEIGEVIPADLYKAVAMVLAYVFQVRNLRGSVKDKMKRPDNVPVPGHYDEQFKR